MVRVIIGIATAGLLLALYRAERGALREVDVRGGDLEQQRATFRRRGLGIVLVAALAVGVLVEPEATAALVLRARLVYYGLLGLLLGLLLLIVLRDLRAIAAQSTREYQETTLRALGDLEEHLRRARASHEAEQPAPPPPTTEEPRDDHPPHNP